MSPQLDIAEDYRASADHRTISHLEDEFTGVSGALAVGVAVVRQGCVGADKGFVSQPPRTEHSGTTLQYDAIANFYASIDVSSVTNSAVFADHHVGPDARMGPNYRSLPYSRGVVDHSRRVDRYSIRLRSHSIFLLRPSSNSTVGYQPRTFLARPGLH